MAKSDNSFPQKIAEEVKDFHLKLVNLKKGLQPIISNLYQIRDDIEKAKDPIKAATLELTMCQAINSLFYIYLQTTGVDTRSHAIGSELYRVEKYTDRLRQIRHKVFRPKVNKRAAGAFVRNALFDPDERQKSRQQDDWNSDEDEQQAAGLATSGSATQADQEMESGDQDDSIREKPAKRMRTN